MPRCLVPRVCIHPSLSVHLEGLIGGWVSRSIDEIKQHAEGGRGRGRWRKNKTKTTVTYVSGPSGFAVRPIGCAPRSLISCWGRADGRLSSCTALAPDEQRIVSYPSTFDGWSKNSHGSTLFSDRKEGDLYDPRNVFETHRAEFDAPPQLDPVEIEVPIGPQREIDFVVYERL